MLPKFDPRLPSKTQEVRYSFIVVLAWVIVLAVIANLLVGCYPSDTRPDDKPLDAHAYLLHATGELTAANKTVGQAINAGILDPAGPEYARIYPVLARAKATLEDAWSIYRAGDVAAAQQSGEVAMAAYASVRPMIATLAEGLSR